MIFIIALYLKLKCFYSASAVHYYIVLIVYDDANYVTVPHTGPTGDTWKSGCDRLVSEPTLSELNTSLLCLISVTQLHIPRFSSLDKELRKCSTFRLFYLYFLLLALSYIFVVQLV